MLASDYHEYVHYAFVDYSSSTDVRNMFMRDKVSDKYFKNGGLAEQFKTDYKSQMVSGDTDEYGNLLEFIENPDILKQYFDVSYADVQSTSVRQMLKTDNLASAEQIAETVSSFLNNFNKVIELICEEIGVKGLDSFKSAVIKEYCAVKGVKAGSKNFANKVIQDVLTHDGMKKLKLTTGVSSDLNSSAEESAVLNSCLRSCLLAAEALKDFGSGGQQAATSFGNKKYSTGSSNGKSHYTGGSAGTLQVLVGKLQGLFSNIVGVGGELAFKKASQVGWKKLVEEVKANEKAWVSSHGQSSAGFARFAGGVVSCDVKMTGSNMVKDEGKDEHSVSKPDVVVTVTDNKVTITYGASVKRYKANKDGIVQSVSLVSGSTSFLEALERYCGDSKSTLNYVYNVAGGREGKSARSDKMIRAKRGSISLSELVERWNEVRDCVVMSNFLHYISGLENASSLFLVVNKQIYPIQDLLSKMSSDNVKASLWTKEDGATRRKVFSRKQMYSTNNWVGGKARTHHDSNKAAARSEATRNEIHSLLASVKLDVTLKDFASLC